MKYVFKMRVPFSQTGAGEELSTIGAAEIIEDSVCAFFALFGKDSRSVKQRYNAVWMLVKNKFQMQAAAKWNEEITVECFFTEITPVSVVVDTVIKNGEGKTLVAARSKACVVDLTSFRIKRISTIDFPADMTVFCSKAGIEFTRFDIKNGKKAGTTVVPSTAIDCCMHLNNVEHLRLLLNTVSLTRELSCPVSETEIHYVNQARFGDVIDVFTDNEADCELYELKSGDITIAKCRLRRKLSQ